MDLVPNVQLFNTISTLGHEEVIFCQDPTANYRAILAIHSTRLGPALGGTRFRRYEQEDAALLDALRLSRAMTTRMRRQASTLAVAKP